MKKISWATSLLILLISTSCSTNRRVDTNFTYFQRGLDSIGQLALKEPVIKPNDQLFIQVISNSLDQIQTNTYNTANGMSMTPGGTLQQTGSSNGFLVDENGDISYPKFGKLHIAGMTLRILKDSLQKRLAEFVKDPDLNIRFLNFKVNILGEVKSPGPKSFLNQRVTILDAIGAAGDLNDYGKRNNILVMREENGTIKNYQVDLRGTAFFSSPAYQLQQNDVVYVSPNDVKLKTVKRNPNIDRDLQLTFSFISLFTVLLSLYNTFK